LKIIVKTPRALNILLIQKGFTQRRLSKVANVSNSMISQIIRGIRSPGPLTAKSICEVLHVDFDDIFLIKGTSSE
jgi:putative transcriptional regulator